MTIEGLIIAPTRAGVEAAFDRLNAAVSLDETPMIVAESLRVRHSVVQRKGEVIPTYLTDSIASYSILISATGPAQVR